LGENDELLEAFGATYTLVETSAGWKAVMAALHDQDVILVG